MLKKYLNCFLTVIHNNYEIIWFAFYKISLIVILFQLCSFKSAFENDINTFYLIVLKCIFLLGIQDILTIIIIKNFSERGGVRNGAFKFKRNNNILLILIIIFNAAIIYFSINDYNTVFSNIKLWIIGFTASIFPAVKLKKKVI